MKEEYGSIEAVRQALDGMTIHVIAYTHPDWSWCHTRQWHELRYIAVFEELLRLIQSGSGVKWYMDCYATQMAPVVERRPDLIPEIRGAVEDDAAVLDDVAVGGDLEGQLGVLLDEQDGHAGIAVKALNCLEDRVDDLGRQAEGGLVEHEQLGLGHQRSADREHLLLATGQIAGDPGGHVAEFGQQPIDLLEVLGLAAAALAQGGVSATAVGDALLNIRHPQLRAMWTLGSDLRVMLAAVLPAGTLGGGARTIYLVGREGSDPTSWRAILGA